MSMRPMYALHPTLITPEKIRDFAVDRGWRVTIETPTRWLVEGPKIDGARLAITIPKQITTRYQEIEATAAIEILATNEGKPLYYLIAELAVAHLLEHQGHQNEATNRLIAAILPVAVMGRELPEVHELMTAEPIAIDLDQKILRRAWEAVQFATSNLPAPAPAEPMVEPSAETLATLRALGLDRSNLPDQVYYLAERVRFQEKQLRSWEEQEAAREARDLAGENGEGRE